jgi:4-amino-4-deoxy-L-arabinose transferase-like glycosyltransferase
MGPNRWLFLAFLVGSFFILFFNLWGRSLENHDYLRYAEVAKEMVTSGDWIVPRLNGEIYIHKPPFLYWLIAFPSNIFGSVTPFLARVPSAMFAWIGGIVIYLWGQKMWGGKQYGLVSSGILISSHLYFWQGRIARTDMVFGVLILFSLYFFYLRFHEDAPDSPSPQSSPVNGKGRQGGYLLTGLSFIFMGMAGMTKGPVGVLFPLLIMFLFLVKQKKLNLLIQKEFILGYVIVVFLFGSWVIYFFFIG